MVLILMIVYVIYLELDVRSGSVPVVFTNLAPAGRYHNMCAILTLPCIKFGYQICSVI
jgi:hypothetical protein